MSSSQQQEDNYSFVIDTKSRDTLTLLQTKVDKDDEANNLVFEILETSLSANNKFYVDFGDKPPFHFFKCYPVNPSAANLVDGDTTPKPIKEGEYVHPPVWGVCKVIKSNMDDVPVGTHYYALLPMTETVSFEKATINKKDNTLVIHRPETNPAYNVFTKANPDDTRMSKEYGALANVCFPGIVTGFGLYYDFKLKNYYGDADTIVITSASSKVALALALFLKEDDAPETKKKTIIGYTSDGKNKEFCESTGLYDTVLGYSEKLVTPKGSSCIMVEISGNGKIYTDNEANNNIVKLLCIGNASGTKNSESSFASFSAYAKLKMILTMMGIVPSWIRSLMNPTQEVFLIMDTAAALKKEWGMQKYAETMEEFTRKFCTHASKWMLLRTCETEESIQTAYKDIMEGTVPPTEAIVLNVAKAVSHRRA